MYVRVLVTCVGVSVFMVGASVVWGCLKNCVGVSDVWRCVGVSDVCRCVDVSDVCGCVCVSV